MDPRSLRAFLCHLRAFTADRVTATGEHGASSRLIRGNTRGREAITGAKCPY